MKNSYLCPKCNGYLNVGEDIIFSVKTKSKDVGLIILSMKLGDYSARNNPKFKYKSGERVDFFCPICHANLAAKNINENLAKVKMVDDENNEFTIVFSGIAGEKCTYKIKQNIEAFGEDSKKYMKYLHLGSM
ncbi:MAG: hypothetical protein ABIJ97_02205 [Bacteroidota bacterium]